jgi:transposase-like protein
VLCVDGVYVKVKGYPKAVPFIYGVDFATHDIPAGFLALGESEAAFERFFSVLKDTGYPLRLVVADEAPGLKGPLSRVFPGVPVQLCHVHAMRNIRTLLHLSKNDSAHLPFFRALQRLLATQGEERRREVFQDIAGRYTQYEAYWDILYSLKLRREDLFRFESMRKEGLRCPTTNNLIEAYNSHLKGRLKSIKGFERFSTASAWLNGWLLRRRFQPFRDCGQPFKHLNGHTSFEQSRNPDLPWPDICGLSPSEIPTRK